MRAPAHESERGRPRPRGAGRQGRADVGVHAPGVSLVLTFGLLWLCVSTVSAHQLSDSFLILQVTNGQLIGHWDIAVKDLLHAKGVDPLDPRFNDLRSLDPEAEMKAVNVLSRLKITIDGAAAEIKPVDYSTEVYNDGPYAAMYFEIALSKVPRFLEVHY